MSRYEDRNGLLVPTRRFESLADFLRHREEQRYLQELRRRTRANLPGFGGRPGYTPAGAPPAALSLVNANQQGSTSVASPATHAINDVFVVFAIRDTNTTAITTPSGWSLAVGSNANTPLVYIFYKLCASTSETCTGFTNAQRVLLNIYRGVNTTTPIGVTAVTNAGSPPYDLPTLSSISSDSWVVGLCSVREGTSSSILETSTFTSMTRRSDSSFSITACTGWAGDSNGPWGSTTFSVSDLSDGVVTSRWRSVAAELKQAV